MQHWQSGFVEANGIKIHYTRTGGARSPVVLAHGFSDDGLCWAPVAEELADDYDLIMVDARGHGRSDAPEQGYGPADHAADLAAVVAALGLGHPPVLGHSMGAATALTLAGTYPDVPGAILLEDPPSWWVSRPEEQATDDTRWAGMRAWAMGLKRKTRAELIAEQASQAPNWSEAELGPWADSKHRLSLNVLNRESPAALDWPAIMRRITCPALLIIGDPQRGAIVTEGSAAALKALVPQLSIAPIADAGHSIRRDQFERYVTVVRAFLAEASGAA